LDLFSGAGGAAMGYHRAGFDVVGVDTKPQPRYPFEFRQADALMFPIEGFDAVHASPTCQRWTAYARRHNHVGEYPNLIGPVRERLEAAGVPWVIENVRGSELQSPIQLCGTSWPLLAPPCSHGWQTPRFAHATNRVNLRSTVEVGVWRIPLEVQQEAMGIDWMTLEELSEAIPPAYTEFIGARLLEVIQ
jgi:DNA (cytosine-5)-methyltransferase 1